MLDKQMRRANLALGNTRDSLVSGARAVMRRHEVLKLVAVGSGGGLPSRNLLGHVEVVGEVLRLGVSNFPVGRETGFRLSLHKSVSIFHILGILGGNGRTNNGGFRSRSSYAVVVVVVVVVKEGVPLCMCLA